MAACCMYCYSYMSPVIGGHAPSTDTASAQLCAKVTPCCARHQISPPVAAYLLATALEQAHADADAANRSVAAGGAGHGMGS